MKNRQLYVLVILLAATQQGVFAQQKGGDTTLKTNTVIEVVQEYKPQVKKAPKPGWMPVLPKPDTTHPVFNFAVPQQTLYYSYSPEPIKPMTLGKVAKTLPFGNYVKAGVGNLQTLYF
ncbi:MAG: hypothetical protein EBZ77_08985, partial [Chitinophagia bacterium]|nr:hypothetical protein [Chitinophagia bacterium]